MDCALCVPGALHEAGATGGGETAMGLGAWSGQRDPQARPRAAPEVAHTACCPR